MMNDDTQPLVPLPSRQAPPSGHPNRALWAAVAVCLAISLLSLALSGILVFRLVGLRQTVAGGLDAAIAALDSLDGEGIHFDYHLSQTIPFSGDIPVEQELLFPFQGKVPINTTVKVPVSLGALGEFSIDVPVNTTFDVDVQVPVSISQTIHVETDVPVDMVIPIDLGADSPLVTRLAGQVRDWLLELRESL